MLGVCVGVAALITIISVMNGFEGELRGRLVGLTAHVTVTGEDGRLENWQDIAARAASVPWLKSAAPFVDVQGVLGRSRTLRPAVLRGIGPAAGSHVGSIEQHLLAGRLADLTPGSRRLIIGRVLAWQLGADVGDELTVMVPGRELLSSGGRPRLQ